MAYTRYSICAVAHNNMTLGGKPTHTSTTATRGGGLIHRTAASHKSRGSSSQRTRSHRRAHSFTTKKIQNYSSSRSSKVTLFHVNKMPITDYVLEYNNFSLGDEDSENIASERYENRHLRRPLSCLMPHISGTPVNICITLISLETTFTGLHFRR